MKLEIYISLAQQKPV